MKGFKEYIETFGRIKPDQFEELSKCFTEKKLKKNDLFNDEGQVAKEFGFLEKGIIRAYFRDDEGREFTKQFFVGPSVIGAYTSLLTGQPSTIIHQALSECNIFIAQYDELLELYDRHHSVERIGRKIAEFYYIEKEKKLIEQAVCDAEKRYLLFQERFSGLEDLIPQYYIASYVGVTPTQLSRIRKQRLRS